MIFLFTSFTCGSPASGPSPFFCNHVSLGRVFYSETDLFRETDTFARSTLPDSLGIFQSVHLLLLKNSRVYFQSLLFWLDGFWFLHGLLLSFFRRHDFLFLQLLSPFFCKRELSPATQLPVTISATGQGRLLWSALDHGCPPPLTLPQRCEGSPVVFLPGLQIFGYFRCRAKSLIVPPLRGSDLLSSPSMRTTISSGAFKGIYLSLAESSRLLLLAPRLFPSPFPTRYLIETDAGKSWTLSKTNPAAPLF